MTGDLIPILTAIGLFALWGFITPTITAIMNEQQNSQSNKPNPTGVKHE